MSDEDLKQIVQHALHRIAPEIDLSQLDPSIDLREQVDLDSMDILNLAIAIHEATAVDIPEADYPHMVTIDGAIAYLRSRLHP